MLINGSLGYRGDLIVVGVPKGSVWSLSLSDVPIVRAPHSNIGLHNFSGSNYQPVNPPAEPKPVSDNAAALERQMRPRQINDTKAQRRQ